VALDVVGGDLHPLGGAGRDDRGLRRGLRSHRPFQSASPRPCIFEHIYFARPDSIMDGASVYTVRKQIGAELAMESPVDADYVVPVPDSGVPAAIGFAQQSGIPFELGIIRSHYVGRTFIQPSDSVRHLGRQAQAQRQQRPHPGQEDRLIDDSIVRGTTSLKIVQMMRDAGRSEVHMRIASPPTRHSCFYGVDTPERAKLLAAQMMSPGWPITSTPTASPSSRSTPLPRPGEDIREELSRSIATAASPGDYPTRLTDHEDTEPADQLALLPAERYADAER
jgi:amidophosphoribosyltransferase